MDLEKLCAVRADPRTQLEAEVRRETSLQSDASTSGLLTSVLLTLWQAYSQWMRGNVLLQRDRHAEALKRFVRAK